MGQSVKRIQAWLLLVIIGLSVQACLAGSADFKNNVITITGILKKQGITAYMYGDYVVVDQRSHSLYAIKKGKTNLEPYLGRKVTIKGTPIKGYPVDFGPPYIQVNTISSTKED